VFASGTWYSRPVRVILTSFSNGRKDSAQYALRQCCISKDQAARRAAWEPAKMQLLCGGSSVMMMLAMLAVMVPVRSRADGAGFHPGRVGRRNCALGSGRGHHKQRREQEQEKLLHTKTPPRFARRRQQPSLQAEIRIAAAARRRNHTLVPGVVADGTALPRKGTFPLGYIRRHTRVEPPSQTAVGALA